MITKMTVTNIHVIDQDSAYDFYVNKLGFRVVDDIPMGPGTRWLTVSPPDQPDLQLVLFPVKVTHGKAYARGHPCHKASGAWRSGSREGTVGRIN